MAIFVIKEISMAIKVMSLQGVDPSWALYLPRSRGGQMRLLTIKPRLIRRLLGQFIGSYSIKKTGV
jgi:hypothetical protein